MNKHARRNINYLQRSINQRNEEAVVLIVCEGKKTEPNYFRSFRVSKKIHVLGEGDSPLNLVKKALEEQKGHTYDQVWCVFDRDSVPPNQFNTALQQAEQHDIKVAYSNECFELWYLLHFHFYQTAIQRAEYPRLLSEALGCDYRKSRPDMYALLESRQTQAIRNAKHLLQMYQPVNPEKDNPSTTVFRLVEALNKLERE